MARILVTRASQDAAATARLIGAAGHEAVLCPLSAVESVMSPAPARPDRLIATSANAFRFGADIPADWLDLPVCCVGEATARAARDRGFGDVAAAGGDVQALLATLAARPGERFVYLCGEPRRPDLERHFLERCMALALWLRYSVVRATDLPAEARHALARGRIDAVLHFSIEGAKAYLDLAKSAGLGSEALRPLQGCLSHQIAALVRESATCCDETRICLAQSPDAAELVHAVSARI